MYPLKGMKAISEGQAIMLHLRPSVEVHVTPLACKNFEDFSAKAELLISTITERNSIHAHQGP